MEGASAAGQADGGDCQLQLKQLREMICRIYVTKSW